MDEKKDRIILLGLGGGGGRIVAALNSTDNSANMIIAAADTDSEALLQTGRAIRIRLGDEWAQENGCGGDAVLGEHAAGASSAALRELIAGAKLLIVIAGLGGGSGAGSSKVVARLVREKNVPAIFLVTMPFSFEGNYRQHEAEKALEPLFELTETLIVVPNDILFTTLPADTSAEEAFQLADTMLAESIAGLARVALSQGLIRADFATVRSLLRRRRARCTLGVGRGEGEDSWRSAIEAFVDCPLIGGTDTLAQADAAVLTLLGGPQLSVGEIQTCLTALQEKFPEEAQLLVGAYTDPQFENRLQITGLICTYQPDKSASGTPLTSQPGTVGKRRRKTAKLTPGQRQIQGELPLQEQSLGIFAAAHPTTVEGQNLDIPTFQRRGINLDTGDN